MLEDATVKNDPSILWGFARALYHNGSCEEAVKALDALEKTGNRDYRAERNLLRTRALEGMGEIEEALAAYEPLAGTFNGEEARCRYGLLLRSSGKEEKALQVFGDTCARKKRCSRLYKSRQREWFHLAAKQIRKIESRHG